MLCIMPNFSAPGIVMIRGVLASSTGNWISLEREKTFLEAHKLSLTQLNHYFKQPVINEHVLMAQRLADEVGDGDIRKQAYTKIINSLTDLVQGYVEDSNLTGTGSFDLITTVPASLSCQPCFLLSIPTHISPKPNGSTAGIYAKYLPMA